MQFSDQITKIEWFCVPQENKPTFGKVTVLGMRSIDIDNYQQPCKGICFEKYPKTTESALRAFIENVHNERILFSRGV